MFIVTVLSARERDTVAQELAGLPYVTSVEPQALPSVLHVDLDPAHEADFMLWVANNPRVGGAADGDQPLTFLGTVGTTSTVFPSKITSSHAHRALHRALTNGDRPPGATVKWQNLPHPVSYKYNSARLGSTVAVAVVDSGVKETHEQFTGGRVTRIYNQGAGDTYFANDHGSGVASLIAGNTMGYLPGAIILDVRVESNSSGMSWGSLSSGLSALYTWATDGSNADGRIVVCNLSVGAGGFSYGDPIGAILSDVQDAGVICFAAAGNDGMDHDTSWNGWPADALPYGSVGATELRGKAAAWSDYGPGSVKIWAWGQDIPVAKPSLGPSAYTLAKGTSFSCPIVVGAFGTWVSDRFPPRNKLECEALQREWIEDFCTFSVPDRFGNPQAAYKYARHAYEDREVFLEADDPRLAVFYGRHNAASATSLQLAVFYGRQNAASATSLQLAVFYTV